MSKKRQYLSPTATILVVNTMQILAKSGSGLLDIDEEEYDDNSRQSRERNSWPGGSDSQSTGGSTDVWDCGW